MLAGKITVILKRYDCLLNSPPSFPHFQNFYLSGLGTVSYPLLGTSIQKAISFVNTNELFFYKATLPTKLDQGAEIYFVQKFLLLFQEEVRVIEIQIKYS